MSSDPLDHAISDELLRGRIRRLLPQLDRPSRLGRLLAHPLSHLAIGFLLTGILGAWLTHTLDEQARSRDRTQQEQTKSHEKALADRRQHYDTSLKAIDDFAQVLYARHTTAMLLYSALKRGASQDEIRERKKLYDDAFLRWGVTHQSHLLRIRRVAKASRYTSFENSVEQNLVPILREIDRALTEGCDAILHGKAVGIELKQAQIGEKLQAALDESYAITNSLFEAVSDATDTGGR